jgi:hypothetical protein
MTHGQQFMHVGTDRSKALSFGSTLTKDDKSKAHVIEGDPPSDLTHPRWYHKLEIGAEQLPP